MTRNFYDSYAVIEYLEGNPAFLPYFQEGGVTTINNCMEVFYHMLRKHGIVKARNALQFMLANTIEVSPEDIEPAMVFRYAHRKKEFSFIDALGYHIAQSKGLRFITGDVAFKGFPHVEYVK